MSEVRPGKSFPLGASVLRDGVNFSVYSKSATRVELLLFDDPVAASPSRVIGLDPERHRTFRYWHAFVPGIRAGQVYAFRVQGPWDPSRGHRFDPSKVLLDPYGRAVRVPPDYDRTRCSVPGDNCRHAMKSVVVDPSRYDWEGDRPLRRPFGETVIYEMHVAGFTRHRSSEVPRERRGTFAGITEKIPYLVDLGITAIELLPVFQFDRQEAPPGLTNYWGYNPVSFFAPHCGYSVERDPIGCLDEFRDMVKALHRAGIEVILDVVYNHTAEGNHLGPTFSLKGLENSVYYMLENGGERYANHSGTGNTLNANHSVVRRMILDSLRYWVDTMHVDGFRFDLASILSRDPTGKPLANPPVLWDIETDPVLAGTKLIAEAWDASGLYQVGSFFGDRWKEWNGRFRDDVRRFLRGDDDTVESLASRLLASPDLYGHENREPDQSVNFVTCHDGFTLNDLVSYDTKHNEANGEGNRDGRDENFSWNCGVEGPTEDPSIERLRNRQVKNFLTVNLLGLGAPMLLMGDEFRRTQGGNNNVYCQDNETGWLDWSLLERHRDVHRFVRRLIRLRLSLDILTKDRGLTLVQLLRRASIRWHGVRLDRPDWSRHSHSLALSVRGGAELFHAIFNAWREPLEFELLPAPGGREGGWRRIIDTSLDAPDDFCDPSRSRRIDAPVYLVPDRTVVLLASRIPEGRPVRRFRVRPGA